MTHRRLLLPSHPFTILALVLALLPIGVGAHAQTELAQPAGYAGLSLGLAKPTNLQSRLGFGASVGLSFPAGWSGGLFFLNSTGSDSGTDVQLMHYGLEGAYRFALTPSQEPESGFGQAMTGLKLGGRLGMATARSTASGTTVTTNGLTVGPTLAYDFKVAEGFSIGAESSVMYSFGDASYSTLYLLATGKYYF